MNTSIDRPARVWLLLITVALLAYMVPVYSQEVEKNSSVNPIEISRLAYPAPADDGQPVSRTLGTNVALDQPVISRAGGVDYVAWGNANDADDFSSTTRAGKGRWGNSTNSGGGTYEIIDLGREYTLTGVGYSLDWDAAYANPLTFQVLVSTDYETWRLVTNTVHRYAGNSGGSQVDIDLAITPVRARYVKYLEPPDGAWNGWGDFFQLRAYAED